MSFDPEKVERMPVNVAFLEAPQLTTQRAFDHDVVSRLFLDASRDISQTLLAGHDEIKGLWFSGVGPHRRTRVSADPVERP